MPWISQESPKLYWKIAKKSGKWPNLTVKNGIFKEFQKSSISYGTRFSQPKYHIPMWKIVTGSLKQKKIILKSWKTGNFVDKTCFIPEPNSFPDTLKEKIHANRSSVGHSNYILEVYGGMIFYTSFLSQLIFFACTKGP